MRRASLSSPTSATASARRRRHVGELPTVGQPASLLVLHQRVADLVELTGEHAVELVQGEAGDAMVGDAVLLEVVRADLLRAPAATDLALASYGQLRALAVLFELEQPAAQHDERLGAVLYLTLPAPHRD